MSSASSSLPRLLLGSLIGAVIGLILLALGVAILWNAADQRLAEPAPPLPEATEERASPVVDEAMTYPVLPAPATPPPAPIPVEPVQAAMPSLWGSIFDTDDEAAPPPRTAPPAAAPRPAPRPSTLRRAPEAQRQEDSLFF